MAQEVSATALVSREQVQLALMRSDEGDVLRSQALERSGSFIETGVEEIEAVSNRICDYLNRRLMVSEVTEYTAHRDWCAVERHPTDQPYRFFARRWPVLAVIDANGRTTTISKDGEKVYAGGTDIPTFAYIAGYRRQDQDLTDFSSAVQNGLSNTSDIPTVPPVMVSVAKNMVIHRLMQRLSGLVGLSETEQQTGDWDVTVRKRSIDTEFERQELLKIRDLQYAI